MERAEDRRIQRTKNLLMDALIDLMIEKGYDAVTIQDLVDYANVGRSTFYLHFSDKEQLLVAGIGQLHDFIKEQSVRRAQTGPPDERRFSYSLPMLQHAQSHKRLYKAIAGKKGGGTVMYHMQRMMADLVHNDIEALLPQESLPISREAVFDYVINTFNTLLTWWMNQDMPCSAMEVDRIFHQLTLSGLKAFL